jgi:hypothetical protein
LADTSHTERFEPASQLTTCFGGSYEQTTHHKTDPPIAPRAVRTERRHPFPRLLGQSEYNDRAKAVAPLMEAALRWLAEATPGSAQLLRLMGRHPRSVRRLRGHREALGPVRLPQGPGLEIDPAPASSTHTRESSYLAGRLSTLDARLEDAHMGCSMQTKAWASDGNQGIGQ